MISLKKLEKLQVGLRIFMFSRDEIGWTENCTKYRMLVIRRERETMELHAMRIIRWG